MTAISDDNRYDYPPFGTKKKKAFLVIGPPSSGTRLMTRILMTCGCTGDGGHEQRFDNKEPTDPVIVIRRHHTRERLPPYSQHEDWIRSLDDLGYRVTLIFITRDKFATIKSMLLAPHARNWEEGEKWINLSWKVTFEDIITYHVRFEVISYEAILARPLNFVAALANRYGLNFEPTLLEMFLDGNQKHYI